MTVSEFAADKGVVLDYNHPALHFLSRVSGHLWVADQPQ
jgi:hypothetical protein